MSSFRFLLILARREAVVEVAFAVQSDFDLMQAEQGLCPSHLTFLC